MDRRFIDNHDVILLDMGNTFMFDADRFGDGAAIAQTYAAQGGTSLTDGEAENIIAALFAAGLRYARDPQFYDRYPSTLEMVRELPEATDLPEGELERVVRVFALHEIGTITPDYVDVLHRLRESHRLGVVSNIWSPSDMYFEAFERAGIRDLFEAIVFSSDIEAIKPSPVIFEKAMQAFEAPRNRIVYVGDNFKCDVVGAHSVGVDSVWISPDTTIPDGHECSPDLIVTDLKELLHRRAPNP